MSNTKRRDSLPISLEVLETLQGIDYATAGEVLMNLLNLGFNGQEGNPTGLACNFYKALAPKIRKSNIKYRNGISPKDRPKQQKAEEIATQNEYRHEDNKQAAILNANMERIRSKIEAKSKQNRSKIEADQRQSISEPQAYIYTHIDELSITTDIEGETTKQPAPTPDPPTNNPPPEGEVYITRTHAREGARPRKGQKMDWTREIEDFIQTYGGMFTRARVEMAYIAAMQKIMASGKTESEAHDHLKSRAAACAQWCELANSFQKRTENYLLTEEYENDYELKINKLNNKVAKGNGFNTRQRHEQNAHDIIRYSNQSNL